MILQLLTACDDPPAPPEEREDLEWLFQPTPEPVPAGPTYVVSGSIAGVPLGECTLWACGEVYEVDGGDFSITVASDPCRLDVNCRDDGRIGNWSVVEATREAAAGLALRYPTSAEMHVLTDRGERELQGVADLFRRLSADVTRSDESRARLTGRADHLEHQIRRARERRALGEE